MGKAENTAEVHWERLLGSLGSLLEKGFLLLGGSSCSSFGKLKYGAHGHGRFESNPEFD